MSPPSATTGFAKGSSFVRFSASDYTATLSRIVIAASSFTQALSSVGASESAICIKRRSNRCDGQSNCGLVYCVSEQVTHCSMKERRPVGASDDPRHPAVKGRGATERRARNGGVPGLLVFSARPAPFSATPDGAIHPATRPALSAQQLRQSLLLV